MGVSFYRRSGTREGRLRRALDAGAEYMVIGRQRTASRRLPDPEAESYGLCHTSDSQVTLLMPKARKVGHRRRRPSAYKQAGLAKVPLVIGLWGWAISYV